MGKIIESFSGYIITLLIAVILLALAGLFTTSAGAESTTEVIQGIRLIYVVVSFSAFLLLIIVYDRGIA